MPLLGESARRVASYCCHRTSVRTRAVACYRADVVQRVRLPPGGDPIGDQALTALVGTVRARHRQTPPTHLDDAFGRVVADTIRFETSVAVHLPYDAERGLVAVLDDGGEETAEALVPRLREQFVAD
jgi:hypothetical protein